MISSTLDGYYEAECGRFNIALCRGEWVEKPNGDEEFKYISICYSDGDGCRIDSGYRNEDAERVKEFCNTYGLTIEE